MADRFVAPSEASAETPGALRIWDLPTRIFHWLLVLCLCGSVLSAKLGGNAMSWHFRFGYLMFTLLAFRLLWGLCGGRWSRFSSFLPTPASVWRHLRGRERRGAVVVGHNPLGALSVLAMLALLAMQVTSGLFADDEIASSGPLVHLVSGATSSLLTSWHKSYGQWLILSLVSLHIAAILFYLWHRKQNLILPMIHGDKTLPQPVAPSADGWRQRLLAALLGLFCAAMVAAVLRYGAMTTGG